MKTLHHRKVKKNHQKWKVNQRVNWVSINTCNSTNQLTFINIELDATDVIEGDNDSPQSMGDPNIEVNILLKVPCSYPSIGNRCYVRTSRCET